MLVIYRSLIVFASELGPLISAAIVNDTGNWRWTFYLEIILLFVSLLTILNPETYAPEIIRKRDIRQGRRCLIEEALSPF